MRDHKVILVVCLLLVACGRGATAVDDPAVVAKTDTVRVIIDYGDGVERHFTALPWHKKTTVLAAMQAAQAHVHGIRFEFRGQNDTALLTRIDDLSNEGSGRNWTYRVNDQVANKSFGVFELAAGDTVLWKFK